MPLGADESASSPMGAGWKRERNVKHKHWTCGSDNMRWTKSERSMTTWLKTSGLKFSISIKIFNPDLQNSPQKIIGVRWLARLKFSREKLFYLQLELSCLQLSFFVYSPLRPLLDALSHRKQKAPTVSKEAKTVSKKAPTVSKKTKIVNCK